MAVGPYPRPAEKASVVKATTFRVGTGTPVGTQATIANVTGGATVDAESRVAINLILVRLKAFGLIS